ncbi:hypothetical protein PR048_007141 [Dryococelus australis]|uniref:Integrase catalytic domain-containing protein n=1 Tax=Dryococelus australis TaxID=614101 RepID=A0ABQ9IDD9_9NEOP|nr:hypothetical protein PR048_007141 [Dryococelus australis]
MSKQLSQTYLLQTHDFQEITVKTQRDENLWLLIRYCREDWPDDSQLTEELISILATSYFTNCRALAKESIWWSRMSQQLTNLLENCCHLSFLSVEFANLDDLSAGIIIKHIKSIFARHGVTEVVRADCGTQFNCSPFKQISQEYNFRLITSSPHYQRSNGFVEAEVKNF